jgi:hypothetical protein
MANPVNIFDIAGEDLATFLAKAVPGFPGTTFADIFNTLKQDEAGEEADPTEIENAVGQLWGNGEDDFIQAAYPILRTVLAGVPLATVLSVGQTIPETFGFEFQDNQGSPVTRAHEDFTGDTWRQRFFKASGALSATLSLNTASAVTMLVLEDPTTDPGFRIGDATGPTILQLASGAGSIAQIRLWKTTGTSSGGGDFTIEQTAAENLRFLYNDSIGGDLSILRWPDNNNTFLMEEATAATAFNIGNPSTPVAHTTTTFVGASGTATWAVDNGINAFEGGILYNNSTGTFQIRAVNAARISVNATQFKSVTDSQLTNGTTTERWLNFFADAMTIGGNSTWDGASPILAVGDATGAPLLRIIKGAASVAGVEYFSGDTVASVGDWRLLHDANENFLFDRHDGTAFRGVIFGVDDTDLRLMSGAQGSSTLQIGGTVNAGDAAVVLLKGGTTGVPAVQAIDSGNRVEFSEQFQIWRHYISGGLELTIAQTNITLANDITIGGALNHDGTTVGLYNVAPVTRQDIVGARDTPAAITDLLTKLTLTGIITDSTTAS